MNNIEENFEIFCEMCPTANSLSNEFDRIIVTACLSTSFVDSPLHLSYQRIPDVHIRTITSCKIAISYDDD